MALATNYTDKVKLIDSLLSKMSVDEKKIMLSKMIKTDMKLFFDAIASEQKFLEKESGIDGAYVEEATGCIYTSAKIYESEEKDIEDVRPENIGKVSKEAKDAWLDQKLKEKRGDDRYDGFFRIC